MNLDDFQREVGEWGEGTFPKSTHASRTTHLIREANELFAPSGDRAEETADVFLILLHIAHREGFSLADEAKKKMEINRERAWQEPDADGVGEHVRG